MSITDELRGYVQSWRETPNLMDELDAGDIDGLLGDFEHIADRIDAEHQKAIRELNNLADASVLLPVDADGEVIRIGDVMELVSYDEGYKPVIRTVDAVGEQVFFAWSKESGRYARYEAHAYRHHTPDTWERIIDDAEALAREWFNTDMSENEHAEGLDALVARCKALAGDE